MIGYLLTTVLRSDELTQDNVAYLVLASLLAMGLGIATGLLASRTANPIILHYNRAVGIIVEAARTAGLTLLATVLLIALAVGTELVSSGSALLLCLLVFAVGGAIRLGTAAPLGLLRGDAPEQWLRAAAGCALGVSVFWFVAAISRQIAGASLLVAPSAVTWLCLLAFSGGLTAVLTTVDGSTEEILPAFGGLTRAATALILAGIGAFGLDVVGVRGTQLTSVEGAATRVFDITRIPFEAQVSLSSTAAVWATLMRPDATSAPQDEPMPSNAPLLSVVDNDAQVVPWAQTAQVRGQPDGALETELSEGLYSLRVVPPRPVGRGMTDTLAHLASDVIQLLEGATTGQRLAIHVDPAGMTAGGDRTERDFEPLADLGTLVVEPTTRRRVRVPTTALPASVEIEVESQTEAVLTASVDETIGDFVLELRKDGQEFSFADDPAMLTDIVLAEGNFVLEARPWGGGTSVVAPDFTIQLDGREPDAGEVTESTREEIHTIEVVPWMHSFRLDQLSEVRARATQRDEDIVVSLLQDGRPVSRGDDPPELVYLAEEGNYQLRASLFGSEADDETTVLPRPETIRFSHAPAPAAFLAEGEWPQLLTARSEQVVEGYLRHDGRDTPISLRVDFPQRLRLEAVEGRFELWSGERLGLVSSDAEQHFDGILTPGEYELRSLGDRGVVRIELNSSATEWLDAPEGQ